MADVADVADEFQEAFLESSLALHRAQVSSAPVATGKCLYCEASLAKAGHRWCDRDCRDDWQKHEDASRRRTGRAPVQMPAQADDEDDES